MSYGLQVWVSRRYCQPVPILMYVDVRTAWLTKTKRTKSLRMRAQEFANIHDKVNPFGMMSECLC